MRTETWSLSATGRRKLRLTFDERMKYLIVMLLMLTGCSKEPQVADDFQPSPPVKHPPAPEPEWGTNSQGILSSLKFGSHIVDARNYVGFLAEDRKAYFLRVVNATNRFPGVKPGRVYTIEGTTIVEQAVGGDSVKAADGLH